MVALAMSDGGRPPPGAETAVIVASMIVVMTLARLVVGRDEKRLDEERLERAWPPSSRDSALIGLSFFASPLLGLFAVVFHFFRTRRWRPLGLLLGLAWAFGILVAHVLLVSAVAWAVGYE